MIIVVICYYRHYKKVIAGHQDKSKSNLNKLYDSKYHLYLYIYFFFIVIEPQKSEKKLSVIKEEDPTPVIIRKLKSATVQASVTTRTQSTQLDSREEDEESHEQKQTNTANPKKSKQMPYKILTNELSSESSSIYNDPPANRATWYQHKQPQKTAPPPVVLSTNAIDLVYVPNSNKKSNYNTRKIFQSPHYSIFAYENT